MIVEERRQKLSSLISERGFLALTDLTALMGVSESTVRRDLEVLADAGLIRRTHGGAIWTAERATLPAFDERAGKQLLEKQAIGRRMASLIEDGETILLDGGTTTLEVARALVGRSLQVVTNSLPIAHLLGGCRDIELILIGGYVYPKTGVALGPIACRAIESLHVRTLVLSVSGLDARGLYNGNLLLVETERAMIASAQRTTVVADCSKFGQQTLSLLSDWSPVSRVVVDDGVTPEQLDLVGAGVEVVLAPKRKVAEDLSGNDIEEDSA